MSRNTAQQEKNRQAKVMRQKARARARQQPSTTATIADCLKDLPPDRARAVLREAHRIHRTL